MKCCCRMLVAGLCVACLGLVLGCAKETPARPAPSQPPKGATPGKVSGKVEEPKKTEPAPAPAAEPKKTEPAPGGAEPKKAEPAPAPAPVEPKKTEPAPAPAAEVKPGLQAEFFKFDEGEEAGFLPADNKKKPDVTKVHAQVNFESVDGAFAESGLEDKFHAVWTGVIRIEKAGSYKFYLNSDDGSKLTIDGKAAVDNGGLHAMEEKDGTVELTAGDHAILVEFFENEGGAGCVLSWEPAGGAKEVVPAKVLFHKEKPASK